jgi:hypothetical protein
VEALQDAVVIQSDGVVIGHRLLASTYRRPGVPGLVREPRSQRRSLRDIPEGSPRRPSSRSLGASSRGGIGCLKPVRRCAAI